MATPFLKQVADVYASHEAMSLPEFCFVFPNKRSATFFAKELKEKLVQPFAMPEMMTAPQFISDFSELVEADRFEQLMTLFNVYRSLTSTDMAFDDFIFWGDMLLNDFNDVDRWLVDAREIFTNVRDNNEISSNYLSDNQKEIIRSYWGDKHFLQDNPDQSFWSHLNTKDKPVTGRFFKLWEVLYPLYCKFHERLKSRGLATQGMLYRQAVDAVSMGSEYTLPFKRYIFIGFNLLSTAEIKIFSRLQERDAADFYWDYSSPFFAEEGGNNVGRYASLNKKHFPSRYELADMSTGFPKIRITGVPSLTGQTKVAGEIITKWCNKGIITDPSDAIDTAVVLPDENLFIPMIHSIPESIEKLNVTMGFPVRLTPVAALFRIVVKLQLKARHERDSEMTFFYDDILNLLSMPMLYAAAPEECESLTSFVRQTKLYRIPESMLLEHISKLRPLFATSESLADLRSTREYIHGVLDFLVSATNKADRLQRSFITAYRSALDSLFQSAVSAQINMKGATLLRMVERAVGTETVNFSGEPLQGLQLMGMLETRALDFRNVIILSLNERVFPKRFQRRSFIPDSLRTAYHLDNVDSQECITSYNFYRLLSRAENVELIYDSRTVGGSRPNEMSRFLKQIMYLYPEAKPRHVGTNFNNHLPEAIKMEVVKDSRIVKLLDRFRTGGDKNLSASAVNTYINCPLNFYLSYVEGFKADNGAVDYVDASTFGDIFHKALEAFYKSLPKTDGRIIVTPEVLESYLFPDKRLDRIIEATIRDCYRQDAKNDKPLSGESLVQMKVLRSYADTLLRFEIASGGFEFVAGEYKMNGEYVVNDSLAVNMTQIIDRIDIKNGVMCFIDYKTGADTTKAPSVESIFNSENDKRNKALLQVLFYCNFWRMSKKDDRAIKPMIYSIRHFVKDGLAPITIDKKDIEDYHEVNDEFLPRFNAVLEEIFNPDIPFRQSASDHACMFCSFKSMCDRD